MANPQAPPTSSSEPGWQPGVQDGAHTPGPMFGPGANNPVVAPGTEVGQVLVWSATKQEWLAAVAVEPASPWFQTSAALFGNWLTLTTSAKLEAVAEHVVFQARKTLGGGAIQLRGQMKVKAAEEILAGAELFQLGGGFHSEATNQTYLVNAGAGTGLLTIPKTVVATATLATALKAGEVLTLDGITLELP